MAKLTKRGKAITEKVDVGGNNNNNKLYTPSEAFTLLKELPQLKFKQSVDVSVRLGIDPKKGDQAVRGASNLPHGLGKEVRVAVFAQGEKAGAAEQAGADAVGLDDLAERVQKGDFDFDVVIASPDAMPTVGKLGQLLGPKGLMPNPKSGTVTDNLALAVRNAKSGQARFRTDKGGIVHSSIGRLDFDVAKLEENLHALVGELLKLKPPAAKGVYFRSIAVSSTMGPGLRIDVGALDV